MRSPAPAWRFLGWLWLLLAVACSPTPTLSPAVSPPADFWSLAEKTSGVRLALATPAPDGYEQVPVALVYAQHQAGRDIWLYVGAGDLSASDPTGELAPWSAGLGALRFVVAEGVVYWIPANPAADRLAFLEETSLSSYLDPAQLADLWLEEGNRLRSANEFEAAIPAYQQVIALRPHDAEAFAGLGAAYLGLGRTEEAVQTLQRAVELDPDHYWAHRLLGNAYLKLQRFALAADELTQAYILDPRDPHLLLGIALGQGRSGQRDLALLSLDQLLARTQDDRLRADAEVLWREFSANPP